MTKPITMQKIAEELGLSRRTVSSVINDKAKARGISKATEERVHTYLKGRGYVPSLHARSLRAGAREAVGILYGGLLYSHLIEAYNQIVRRVGG